MKKVLSLFVTCLGLIVLAAACQEGDVSLSGCVYYWNLEEAQFPGIVSENTAVGAAYKPMANAQVEVEYDGATLDDKIFTDDNGCYSVSHRAPLSGDWEVNLEIYAKVKLGTAQKNDIDIVASVFSSATDIWPYSLETSTIHVDGGESATLNGYVGGPDNNTVEYGHHKRAAMYMSQVLRDDFLWTVEQLGVERGDTIHITRDVSVFFPEDKSLYSPGKSPPGTGWIDMAHYKLAPEDYEDSDSKKRAENNSLLVAYPDTIAEAWQTVRNTLSHEYGHKIMHDMYWTMPKSSQFWTWFDSEHDIYACKTPEFGWIEGWAEFYAAASNQFATVDATRGTGASQIEYAYHPLTDELGTMPADANGEVPGTIKWHKNITCQRDRNEGEVAAVLWDLMDPQDWEYQIEEEQGLKPVYWPNPLVWKENVQMNCGTLFSILEEKEPHALMDNNDIIGFPLVYHLQTYAINTHALKAIFFNRGIQWMAENRP